MTHGGPHFFGGSRTDFLDIFPAFIDIEGRCGRWIRKQRITTSGAKEDKKNCTLYSYKEILLKECKDGSSIDPSLMQQ